MPPHARRSFSYGASSFNQVINQKMARVWVPERSFLFHNIEDFRHLPLCRGFQSRTPHICIVFPAVPFDISFAQKTVCRLTEWTGYFFNSIGCPQQCTTPSPPLVTMISTPHFLQTYLLPTWLAILLKTPLLTFKIRIFFEFKYYILALIKGLKF